MQFTDDPYVKETLQFLMTREIAHYQMFEAALETIQPNFPPGVLQGDPRYSSKYFNMSNGASAQGPWNEGKSSQLGETWEYIEDPIDHIIDSQGLTAHETSSKERTTEGVKDIDRAMSKQRSEEIKKAVPKGENQWSTYPVQDL
jgi:Mn-containing catalase